MTKVRILRQGKGYSAREKRLEGSKPADTVGSSPLLLLFPFHFLGYIGPGTGSLIIQVVIASLVGGLFVLKVYWRRITAFFKRGKECEKVEEQDR